MREHPRLTGRRNVSYAERFFLCVAVVVVASLWVTQDLALWATVLCGVGVAAGAVAAGYFGWRHLASRR